MSLAKPATKSSSNRRRYPRTELDHPALLLFQGSGQARCRIRNYSEGGLYLECLEQQPPAAATPDVQPLPDSDQAVIEIPAKSQGQRSEFSIPVRIAYRADSGIGVAFLERGSELLAYLQRLPPARPQALTDTLPNTRHHNREQLIATLRQITRDFLASRLSAFLRQAEQNLLDRANGAVGNQEGTDLLYALSVVERESTRIGDTLMMHLELGLEGKAPILDPAEENNRSLENESGLDLVDKDEFDEWVFIVSLARASESRVYPSLNSLERSLTYLSRRTLNSESNPVSPHYFLWALRNAIAGLGLNSDAKRILFQAFADSIIADIQLLYDQLIAYLARNSEIPLTQPSPAPLPATPAATERPIRRAAKKGALTTLAAVNSISRGTRKSGHGNAAPALTASTQAVLQSLESLPLQLGQSAANRIEEQLEQRSVDGRPVIIDPETRQTIRATEQLLIDLGHEVCPSADMRQLVGRLRVPMIKGAILDPALLNDPDHPMRQLLETIDHLSPYTQEGLAGGSHPSTSLRGLLQQIEQVAADGKPEDIVAATRQAKNLLDAKRHAFDDNLQIVIQSSEQEEALKRKWNRTLVELQALLQGQSVSRSIDQLLRYGWPGLLLQASDEDATSGKRYELYIKVIQFFLKTFKQGAQPHPVEEKTVFFIAGILERGFRDYPVHAEATASFIEHFRSALTEGGDAYQQWIDDRILIDNDYLEQRLYEQAPVEFQQSGDAVIAGPWAERLRALDTGEWIVEHRNQGQVRLLNLAWKDSTSTRFVFVDGDGRKSLESTLAELTGLFDRSRYSLLENRELPLVERTVHRMLKDSFEQIRHDSVNDELTGLMNRKSFEHEIARLIEVTGPEDSTHVLILLDIDQFALVNDLCGFDGGDQLLVTVTNIISTYLSGDGIASRTGDDEFGILLPQSNLDKGYQIAETQRKALANYQFNWESQSIPVSVSSGIVIIDGSKGSPAELLKDASSACSLAKRSGRNCSRIFQPLDREFRDQRRLIRSVPIIEKALAEGHLGLHGQLITPLFSGEGDDHYEVLMRVLDEKGNPTNPEAFIQAAEHYDRMRAVDRWVINEFFSWLDQHASRLEHIGGFTLNLSGQSVMDHKFGDFLRQKIKDSPLPPGKLGFEITETALVTNMDTAIGFIDRLRETGCSFYLDDFGSGYASYSYLKDLPVDYIKIDGIFVKDMLQEESSRAMVRSITEIAHYMDKKVVAEFVESQELLTALRKLDVDYGQGYGIARPIPLNQIFMAQAACG